MKIFIWENVNALTDNWHDSGGAAIIAENLEEARKMLPEKCEAQTYRPDYESDISSEEPKSFIFPDSGCC